MRSSSKLLERAIIGFASVAFLVGTSIYFDRASRATDNDFSVYRKTALRMQAGQYQDLYSLKDGNLPFRYTPPTLPVFALFSLISEVACRRVWFLIQVAGFIAGFYCLWRVAGELQFPCPLLVIALSYLCVVRYYMDSLLCGQVSGLMFVGFAGGLWAAIRRRHDVESYLLILPTLLKIGPGLLQLHALSSRNPKQITKAIVIGVVGFVCLNGIVQLLAGPTSVFDLWKDWFTIAANDGSYYDGAITQSQAIRAVLLRIFGAGVGVERFWLALVGVSSVLLIGFWFSQHAENNEAVAWSYSLGILAFLLFMPESIRYAHVHLAIPLSLIIGHGLRTGSRPAWIIMGFVVAFCSLPGSGVVGYPMSDNIQAYSLPFVAMLMVASYCIRMAWITSGYGR